MSLLEVKNLCVHDKKSEDILVQHLNFSIQENQCLGIVGESGSGKSVTVKAMLGLTSSWIQPSGEVLFQGKNLLDLSARELNEIRGSGISMVIQDAMSAFHPLEKIGKQMAAIFRWNLRISKKKARLLCEEALHRVHLHEAEGILTRYPHELSGGMLQRVMIGIAVIMKPSLIIADEPTTALDSITQRVIIEQFRILREETGTAILFISHDLGAVQYLADEILVMKGGLCVESGKTASVLSNPQHPYTAYLIETRRKLTTSFQHAMTGDKIDVCTSEECQQTV